MINRRKKRLKTIFDFFDEHECSEMERKLLLNKLAEMRYLQLFKYVLR